MFGWNGNDSRNDQDTEAAQTCSYYECLRSLPEAMAIKRKGAALRLSDCSVL